MRKLYTIIIMDIKPVIIIGIILIILIVYGIYCNFDESKIEYFNSTQLTSSWTPASAGQMSFIAMSKGVASNSILDVWGIDINGYLYNSPLTGTSASTWTAIAGPPSVAGFLSAMNTVPGIRKVLTTVASNDNGVFVTANDSTTWYHARPCTGKSWFQFPGGTLNKQIDVNSTQIWGCGTDNTVYFTPIPSASAMTVAITNWPWKKTSSAAIWIAVNDQYGWLMNPDRNLWTTTLPTTDFPTMLSGTSSLDITQICFDPNLNNNSVWAINSSGKLYYNTANNTLGGFTQIQGPTGAAPLKCIAARDSYIWTASTATTATASLATPSLATATPSNIYARTNAGIGAGTLSTTLIPAVPGSITGTAPINSCCLGIPIATGTSCNSSYQNGFTTNDCNSVMQPLCTPNNLFLTNPNCQAWCNGGGSSICTPLYQTYCSTGENYLTTTCQNFCNNTANAGFCTQNIAAKCAADNYTNPYCACFEPLTQVAGFTTLNPQIYNGLTQCLSPACVGGNAYNPKTAQCPTCVQSLNISGSDYTATDIQQTCQAELGGGSTTTPTTPTTPVTPPVTPPVVTTPVTPASTTPASSTATSTTSSSIPWWVWLILALVIVCCCICCIVYANRKHPVFRRIYRPGMPYRQPYPAYRPSVPMYRPI